MDSKNSEGFIMDSVLKLPDVPPMENSDELISKEDRDKLTDEFSDAISARDENKCLGQKLLETKLKIAESTEFNVKSNDASSSSHFDEMFRGDLPHLLLTIRGKDPILKTVDTFDELKAVCEKKMSRPLRNIPLTITSAPVNALTHFLSFGEYISKIYGNSELIDTHIEVEGRHFLAHRAVLCCHSSYLESLLLRDPPKRIPVEIKILGISSDSFEQFLEFIYTGRIRLKLSYIFDMLTMAEKLGIKALRNVLVAIDDQLDLQQALHLLLLCGKNCSNQLNHNLLVRIKRQFGEASRFARFLEMDVDLFCHFLQSDELDIASEFDVFQIALRWIVHGGHDRLCYSGRIMNLIRFPYMTTDEMLRCADETTLFKDNEELRLLLIMSVWYVTALKLQRSDPLRINVPPPRRGYRAKCLPLASSDTNDVPRDNVLDVNHSSRPNSMISKSPKSPRHAKPVLLPTDDQFANRSPIITKSKEKSPLPFAKPILVPQDELESQHNEEDNNTPMPLQTPPGKLAKPVMWPLPTPQKEENRVIRAVPARLTKPIIWPPPKHVDESMYQHRSRPVLEPKPVIASLPVRTQQKFWHGMPPKQLTSPQLSPARYAKPVMVETTNPRLQPTPPVFTFSETDIEETMTPNLCIEHPVRSPSPQMSPARYARPVMVQTPRPEQQSPIFTFPDTPNEHSMATPGPLQQCRTSHVAELVSQFSSKLSTTAPTPCCYRTYTPGRCAKPLMLPFEHEKKCGDLCVFHGNEASCLVNDRRTPIAIEIFIIGGFCNDLHSQIERDGDLGSTQWMRYCNLPAPRRNFAVAMVARKVYLIGGCDPTVCALGHSATNTLYRMDFDTKIWRKMAPMRQCRESHCACAINNIIYVLGGLDEYHRPLSSVECYNVCTDTWYVTTMMAEPRFAAAATNLGGKCYIAGGLTQVGAECKLKGLDRMDCFDPLTNRWERKGSLRMPVCHSSLINVEGSMYLCGGAIVTFTENNDVVLRSIASVEKYNETLDCWEQITEMLIPRHSAAVAAAGSRLFIIGGKNSTAERFLRSTECFNTQTLEWSTQSVDLPLPARSISCVACPLYGDQ